MARTPARWEPSRLIATAGLTLLPVVVGLPVAAADDLGGGRGRPRVTGCRWHDVVLRPPSSDPCPVPGGHRVDFHDGHLIR